MLPDFCVTKTISETIPIAHKTAVAFYHDQSSHVNTSRKEYVVCNCTDTVMRPTAKPTGALVYQYIRILGYGNALLT
jgi:hypothetical protein